MRKEKRTKKFQFKKRKFPLKITIQIKIFFNICQSISLSFVKEESSFKGFANNERKSNILQVENVFSFSGFLAFISG